MSKVQEALMSDHEKRARKLETQRRVICPEGEFVFVHKGCLDNTMFLLEEKGLIVFPGQIEEFETKKILDSNEIQSIGLCDCCNQHINDPSSSFYRLWVLTKSDYEKNIEYRESYKKKREQLDKKRIRHEKWQNIERKTPLRLLPFVRYIRKIAYRFLK